MQTVLDGLTGPMAIHCAYHEWEEHAAASAFVRKVLGKEASEVAMQPALAGQRGAVVGIVLSVGPTSRLRVLPETAETDKDRSSPADGQDEPSLDEDQGRFPAFMLSREDALSDWQEVEDPATTQLSFIRHGGVGCRAFVDKLKQKLPSFLDSAGGKPRCHEGSGDNDRLVVVSSSGRRVSRSEKHQGDTSSRKRSRYECGHGGDGEDGRVGARELEDARLHEGGEEEEEEEEMCALEDCGYDAEAGAVGESGGCSSAGNGGSGTRVARVDVVERDALLQRLDGRRHGPCCVKASL